jgi:hypothetical protein
VGLDLTLARATALGLMESTCRITRVGAGAPIYEGPCVVTFEAAVDQEVGGRPVQVRRYRIGLPFDAAVPAGGDHVLITASPDDTALVDVTMRVLEVAKATWVVTRQLVAVEASGVPR